MQRYIYVIISFFLAVTLSAAPIAAQTDVAAAPSPTQEQEQVQEQVQAQNSETPPLSDALKTPKRAQEPSEEQGFDLSDPALTEALAARAQADRAIAEAVRAQQDKNQLSAAAPAADIAPKKSVFPSAAWGLGDNLVAAGTAPCRPIKTACVPLSRRAKNRR
jgi:hypothetical protein